MSFSNDAIASYERVLAGIARLPPSQEHAPTFLEIAGYPHLENVASNILQFFLQPQAAHNLKGLVLESLLALLDIPVDGLSSAEVVRLHNAATDIDLVVESETFILGIENKIYHAVHNDLADYWDYLVKQSQGRTPYGVLLALTVPPPTVPLLTFQAITYIRLLDQIDVRLGEAHLLADQSYSVLLNDWMRTMRRLTETTALSSQMLAFLSEHQDDIHRLLRETELLKGEMRRKVKTLADLLAPEAQAIPVLRTHGLWRDTTRLVDVLFYDFDGGDGLVVAVGVVVEPAGWRIEIHNRSGSVQQLERWLATRSIATKLRPGGDFRLAYGDAVLPYTTDLTVVRALTQELLFRISS